MSYLGGTRVGRTVTPRNILMRSGDELHLPGPLVLDGGTATYRRSVDGKNTNYTNELRRGWIMAQVTASKKWVPCKRTAVAAGGSGSGSGAGSATVAVVNSAAFIVGEICTIPVTGGQTTPITRTISSIDYTNDLITFSGAAFQVNTGAEIYVSTRLDVLGRHHVGGRMRNPAGDPRSGRLDERPAGPRQRGGRHALRQAHCPALQGLSERGLHPRRLRHLPGHGHQLPRRLPVG
jgi:hypothetical protein